MLDTGLAHLVVWGKWEKKRARACTGMLWHVHCVLVSRHMLTHLVHSRFPLMVHLIIRWSLSTHCCFSSHHNPRCLFCRLSDVGLWVYLPQFEHYAVPRTGQKSTTFKGAFLLRNRKVMWCLSPVLELRWLWDIGDALLSYWGQIKKDWALLCTSALTQLQLPPKRCCSFRITSQYRSSCAGVYVWKSVWMD